MTEESQTQDPRLDPRRAPPWQPLDRLAVGHLWQMGKQIDELGGEWTYQVFVWRVCNFHLVSLPVAFYEPIEDFDRLALEILLRQKARDFDLRHTAGMVGVSLKVFSGIFDATNGVLKIPGKDESYVGEHHMTILGMYDSDTLVVQSTWSGWTTDNLGYVSREYFDSYATEGWIYRRWDYGPSEDTVDALLRTSEKSNFEQLWRRRQRFGFSSDVVPNKRVKLKWFGCWSLQAERPAEVLVVELDGRIRVGVAILIHYGTYGDNPPLSSLSDFFIWPNYRRVGYGRLLENFAAQRSVRAGSKEISVHVWNADAVKGKDRAVAFLRAAGYDDIKAFSGSQYVLYAKRTIA